MTQKDLTKPDAIAMGSYNSDSHNVQRFVQVASVRWAREVIVVENDSSDDTIACAKRAGATVGQQTSR